MPQKYLHGRRKACGNALHEIYFRTATVAYTDEAHYNVKGAMVAVVTDRREHLTSASIARSTAKKRKKFPSLSH